MRLNDRKVTVWIDVHTKTFYETYLNKNKSKKKNDIVNEN